MKLTDYQRELGKEVRKLFQDWRKKYSISGERAAVFAITNSGKP
jgi:hypothetical protein